MKTRPIPARWINPALLLTAWLAGLFAGPSWAAQPETRKVENRFLLIFNTSSEMKRRLPAVQKAVIGLLVNCTARGELAAGDTLGIWTYDQELRTGQFPLQQWTPDDAAAIASNVTAFVQGQHYAKKSRIDAVVPLLNQVVRTSERLTVVVFCDGFGEIKGTPYDTGINQIFQQRQADRQKARLPIAIALRSQLGQYVDCVVSFPPQPITLPAFPPLPPEPSPPQPAPAAAPPRPVAPPLIIIGTPPTNRVLPPAPGPTNPPSVTVTSTPAPPVVTAAPPPTEAAPVRTGPVPAQLTITPELLPSTNAAAPGPAGSGGNRNGLSKPGRIWFFLAAGVVVALGVSWLRKKK
ncbi:MAG TPA: hypothetical protein VMB80_15055 [Candidatus Acidoferrum sp.]|nr:hypothetical protein [Candidatus Acidoferrum sp.]